MLRFILRAFNFFVVGRYTLGMNIRLILAFALISFVPIAAHAQEPSIAPDVTVLEKARVVSVQNTEERPVAGAGIMTTYQELTAEVLEGAEKGAVVSLENDYVPLAAGELFYLLHTKGALDGVDTYAVSEPYRINALLILVGFFVLLVALLGGKQGIRGLIALAGGFVLIVSFLLPGILAGYSPVLISVIVASLIAVVGSYITHGFNRTTSVAVLGMVGTILLTGVLALIAVKATRLTGLSSEESVYLNLNTHGSINLQGLLLGGILIGLLGVLYDAAIGQAVAVEELHAVAPHLSRRAIFKRAMRIGREHIGALVNTLAIAYVGASLPLLLLFYNSGTGTFAMHVNQEIFATEIVRTIVGSVGLILAVPITTLIAVGMLIKGAGTADTAILHAEEARLQTLHGHSH
jgi:uncharacterized membrane protein